MITPEDNMICKESDQGKFGFSALYATCGDNEISAGVILCANIGGHLYMFQLDTSLSPLYDERVNVMPGTLKAYVGSLEIGVNHFNIKECRFPTEEELKWYESTDTV